jgi:hypothetical protein
MKNTNYLCFLLSVVLYCCNSSLASNEKKITENVMSKGDRITASDDWGELTITAGKGNKRYLTVSGGALHKKGWLGDTVSIRLKERKKRYNGSLGLYCDTNVKEIRQKGVEGVTQIKMEEAQMHFETLEDAKKWVGHFKHDEGFNSDTWSRDGLYVRWLSSTPEYWFFPKRSYLRIVVFQIYIGGDKVSPYQSDDGIRYWYSDPQNAFKDSEFFNDKTPVKIGGHKPENLPGAKDDKIKVEHLTDEQLKAFEKSVKPFLGIF